MNDGWPNVAVGRVLRQVRPSVPVRAGVEYPLLGMRWYGEGPFLRETVTADSAKARVYFQVRAGDFLYNRLFAWKGSFGVVPERLAGFYVSGEFPVFQTVPELALTEYINLVMCRPIVWEQILRESTGSTTTSRNRWNESRFLEWEIPLPPLAEQRRIVDLVAAIDSGIAESRRSYEATEAARLALFERFAEKIGAGQTVPLGGIADVVGGITKDEKRQQGDGLIEVPYLRVANVQRGYLDLSEMTMIRAEPALIEKLRLRTGDVLFNEGGDRDKLGRGWVWQGQIADCIHQNHVLRARLKTADFDPWFVSIWGNGDFGRQWFELNGSQTTNLASLNLSTLRVFPIPVVPLADQRRVVDLWMAFDSVSRRARDVESATTALRATLLADLLSGDHEIPSSYDRFLDGAA